MFKIFFTTSVVLLLFAVWKVIERCWVLPLRAYRKLRRNGLKGPTPVFPLGNIGEMTKNIVMSRQASSPASKGSQSITHDIHSTVLPFFSQWQQLHGNSIYIYIYRHIHIYFSFSSNSLIAGFFFLLHLSDHI